MQIMRHRIKTDKTVFLEFHGAVWRECLQHWLDAHPRTVRWRSGDWVNGTVTMSESSWRRFCSDYHFSFKDL